MATDQIEAYTFRTPKTEEFEAWFALYEPYSHAVESPVTREIARSVWNWIQNRTHGIESIVALREGRVVGFVHYRPFPRTLDANEACFLDDLYVIESERGSGLAQLLIAQVVDAAKQRGWTHVRWVTTNGNQRARGLYEKVASLMDLLTYRIDISGR